MKANVLIGMGLLTTAPSLAFHVELVFPWVTHNEQYDSVLVVNELSGSPTEIILTATRANGDEVQVTEFIQGYQQWTADASSLFSALGPGPDYSVRLISASDALYGAYVIRLISGVSGQSPAQANVVDASEASPIIAFSYLPSNADFEAAPVVVNLGGENATVSLTAFQEGLIADRIEVAIPAGRPFADLVSNLFPQLSGDMYVVASSDQPLLGVSFVFNHFSEPSMANAVALNSVPDAPDPQPLGVWVPRHPIPHSVSEMPHLAFEGEVWVIGGAEFGATSDQVSIYNPQTDQWREGLPLPSSRHHLMTASAMGQVFAIGGYFSFSRAEDDVYSYDPASGEWQSRSPIPSGRAAAVATSLDDYIYVTGGVEGRSLTNSHMRYDPIADTWTELTPMPTAREHLAGAVIDGLIYIVGGRSDFSGGESVTILEVYDPTSDSWLSLPGMPTARSGLAAAAWNGQLFVFGGELPGTHDAVESYDPLTSTWAFMEPMPRPLHGIGAATIGRGIYLFGGGIRVGSFQPTDAGHVFFAPSK